MEEKAKQGAVLALGLGAAIAIPLLLRKKKPPEGEGAGLKITFYDAQGNPVAKNSPVTLTEGESYTMMVSVTNQTTRGGVLWEATLGGYVEAPVMAAGWPTEAYLFSGSIGGYFGPGETKNFSFPFSILVGYGGAGGAAIAVVTDPAGTTLATASEPITILVAETIYGATVVW